MNRTCGILGLEYRLLNLSSASGNVCSEFQTIFILTCVNFTLLELPDVLFYSLFLLDQQVISKQVIMLNHRTVFVVSYGGKCFYVSQKHEEKRNWSTGNISELLKVEEAIIVQLVEKSRVWTAALLNVACQWGCGGGGPEDGWLTQVAPFVQCRGFVPR